MKNSNSFFKKQFELHSTLIMRKKIVQFLVYNKFPHIFHQLILGISMIFLFTLRPYHFIIIYSLCFLLLFFSPGKALLAGKGISRQVSSQVLCRHSPPTIQMTSKNSFELVIKVISKISDIRKNFAKSLFIFLKKSAKKVQFFDYFQSTF